ncbi:MAG: phosphatidylserine decarboxylase family protein [Candidatus Omnitrophica bacterium]|nr:phosphatidylserine decarboxylase family protein [Candidatus Omnitrophota bacterium]
MQTPATPHPWSELRVPIDRRAWPGAGILLGVMAALALAAGWRSMVVLPLLAAQLAFFRDPARRIPAGEGVLAPADGVVADISPVTEERYLKAPAVRVGIFLSVFDCHVTRAPIGGVVRYLQYQRGAFLNALRCEAAERNESNRIGVEDGRRRVLVRQIAGTIARRIHWDIALDRAVGRGGKVGIICYGSRVECVVPEAGCRLLVSVGQRVRAGETVLGEWVS